MSDRTHDTLVYRLAQMLVKLNQGERLDPQALAEEFGVNLRTIQRDLNERFAYLLLEKTDGRYHLDPAFLGVPLISLPKVPVGSVGHSSGQA